MHPGFVPPVLRLAVVNANRLRFAGRLRVVLVRKGQIFNQDEIIYRDGPLTRVEIPSGTPGAGQIIVENQTERKHFFPGRNVIRIEPARHKETVQRLRQLAQRGQAGKIRLVVTPGDTVAGFLTREVIVEDDAGNVKQRLFIEPHSGAVLKRQLFDAGGAQVGYFEFSSIQFNPPGLSPALFRFDRKGAKVVTPLDTVRQIATRQGFSPVYLLPSSGFHLDTARMAMLRGQKVLVEVYTGRRTRVSLFQLQNLVDPTSLQQFQKGRIHIRSWQTDGHTFVLVGALSEPELGRLAAAAVNGTR